MHHFFLTPQKVEVVSFSDVIRFSFQRLIAERDSLKETNEELTCTQVQKGEHRLDIFVCKAFGRVFEYVLVIAAISCYYTSTFFIIRADSRFVPSQWEMPLLCNDVSHWLGTNLESALCYYSFIMARYKQSKNIFTILSLLEVLGAKTLKGDACMPILSGG